MISEVINNIKEDLYNLPSKNETIKAAVTEKVEGARSIYLDNIEKNFNFLLSRSNLRLLKTIKREERRKEKEESLEEADND